MKKERKSKHFIHKPTYEGGPTAFKAFISQHLQYPKAALEEKVEGTVFVLYTINHKGKVIDTKIISGVGHGCDEEAARIVRLLTFTVPRNRGVKAIFHKNVQIHFRLPQEKTVTTPELPSSTPSTIQYTMTSSANKEVLPENPTVPKNNSYTYTISYE